MFSMPSAILLVIDGLGDLPTPRTPLQVAKKPNLDYLAKNGITGLLSTIARGVIPGSDVSHLQLFGYDPKKYYPGRGPLEALGVGLELREGDIAFRANFATIKNNEIIDRRAGRITTAEARMLERDVGMQLGDTKIIFKSSVEHRGALIFRGSGLSPKVSDTDSHHEGEMQTCKPLDGSEEAGKTADMVNAFTETVQRKLNLNPINKTRKLPANIVLLRSPGTYRKVPSLTDRFGIRGACVAGGALYKGAAKYVGMDILKVPGATGDAKTDLKAKGKAAVEAAKTHDLDETDVSSTSLRTNRRSYDFVFVHVKAVDSFGHDGNFKEKTRMLEKIDKELVSELRKSDAYLVITGDHSTPCIRKAHSGHEVPILIYGKNERKDSVKRFDEISCMQGGLGHLRGADVLPILLNLIQKGKMYGS